MALDVVQVLEVAPQLGHVAAEQHALHPEPDFPAAALHIHLRSSWNAALRGKVSHATFSSVIRLLEVAHLCCLYVSVRVFVIVRAFDSALHACSCI